MLSPVSTEDCEYTCAYVRNIFEKIQDYGLFGSKIWSHALNRKYKIWILALSLVN